MHCVTANWQRLIVILRLWPRAAWRRALYLLLSSTLHFLAWWLQWKYLTLCRGGLATGGGWYPPRPSVGCHRTNHWVPPHKSLCRPLAASRVSGLSTVCAILVAPARPLSCLRPMRIIPVDDWGSAVLTIDADRFTQALCVLNTRAQRRRGAHRYGGREERWRRSSRGGVAEWRGRVVGPHCAVDNRSGGQLTTVVCVWEGGVGRPDSPQGPQETCSAPGRAKGIGRGQPPGSWPCLAANDTIGR